MFTTDTLTRYQAVCVQRAALWELLKAQARITRDLRARAVHWRTVAMQRRADAERLGGELRRLRTMFDAVSRESDLREDEIVGLGYEVERLIATYGEVA